MLTLITGRSGSGKSTVITEMIKESISRGRRVYLIVPEQQTVAVETKLTDILPQSASRQLDVLNFTRLADLVFRTFGGCAEKYLSKSASSLLMYAAENAVLPLLEAVSGKEDDVPLLLSAVSEVRSGGITAAELSAIAERFRECDANDPERFSKEALSRKLGDLSVLMAAYSELGRGIGADPDELLPRLAETLETHGFFGGSDVYFDSFFSLTPIEYKILSHIMRQADNVVFSCTCPDVETNEPQFAFTDRCRRKVLSLASRFSRDGSRVIHLGENRRAAHPDIAALDGIFDTSAEPYTGPVESVSVTRCRDRYEQAAAITSRILELMQSGIRCREIAVIARDIGTESGMLDVMLERAGIPYYMSRRVDIMATAEMRLIFALLSLVSSGWRSSDMIAAVKTGFFPIAVRDIDIFVEYVEAWHISGRRAFCDGVWSMNPDGYTDVLTERGQENLLSANAVREAVVPMLERFAELFVHGATVTDVCRGLWELLDGLEVYKKCAREARHLREAGEHDRADIKKQLPEVINTLLDTLVSVLPDAEVDAERFSRLFRMISSSINIGSIPSGLDRVTLGSANALRVDGIRHVILIDVNEGVFPRAADSDGFFTDHDKLLLEGEDVMLPSGEDERAEGELLWFYRSLNLASDGVDIFFPDSEGSISSGGVGVLELLPELKVGTVDGIAAERFIRDPVTAYEAGSVLGERGRAFADALVSERPDILGKGRLTATVSSADAVISPETAERLFPSSRLYLTQSRLDSFVLCRFGFMCNYILKLRERKQAKLMAVDVGNFIHRMLERFFSAPDYREIINDEVKRGECVDSLIGDYIAAAMSGRRDARSEDTFRRLRRSVMNILSLMGEEFEMSGFRPTHFELPISSGNENAPDGFTVELGDGTTATLGGKIDRLDVFRDGDNTYVRVVDYKTGVKKFSLDDIKYGLNMQLLVYLFSVWKCPPSPFRDSLAGDGSILPAGALYFSVSPGEINKSGDYSPEEAEKMAKDGYSRSGIFIDDVAILDEMDPGLSGRFIPVKLKKDGGFARGADIASLARFGELYRELSDTVGEIARKMKSGAAEARPVKHGTLDPCTYCRMKAVCRVRFETK